MTANASHQRAGRLARHCISAALISLLGLSIVLLARHSTAQSGGSGPSLRRTSTAAQGDGSAKVEDLAATILGAKLRVDGDKIIVSHIKRGGPADMAGIRPGDQLTGIEKHKISSLDDVLKVLQHYKAGQGVVMTVIPKAQARQLFMAPPPSRTNARPVGTAMLGATLNDASGVVTVGQLSVDGPAVIAGLRTGDQLLSIDGQKFKTVQQLTEYISHCHPGTRIYLMIRRDNWQRTLVVTLGSRNQVAGLPKMNVPPIADNAGTDQGGNAQPVQSTSVDDGDEWADESEAEDMYNVNDRALYTDFD